MRWWPFLLVCSACSRPALPATTETNGASAGTPPPIFEFHSSRWNQTHHWLHYAATARRPAPSAAPLPPQNAAWGSAVAFYRERYAPRGGFALIFDEELIGVHRALSALAPNDEPSMLDPAHQRHLAAAQSLMNWPVERERNRRWIAALEPRVKQHGEAMVAALSELYATPWPKGPIRVDVSCFAGPVGAYTVSEPVHIIISSCDPDYVGEGAFEMIFHEASHALSDGIETRIAAAAAKRGREPPRNLWHAVIFYTAGALARRQLGDNYTPYAKRRELWGGPMGPREPLEAEWQPYLDGQRSLDEAIERLVAHALAP